ncbi:sensor histidine kinase [Fibrella arboris]|uniref:sensor histidine kinase n=1 Tax=Fibrella arboris TaxID=3242486 RepID=UPI0035218E2B
MCRRVWLLAGALAPAWSVFAQAPPQLGKRLYEKLAHTQREYQAAMAAGDSVQVAEFCYQLGKRYNGLGDYVVAQGWFFRSLRIREPLGYSENVGRTYLWIAENQTREREFSNAMASTRRALVNFRQDSTNSRSRHGLMSAYVSLAGIYVLGEKLNRDKPGTAPASSLDSSIYYYGRAEALALALKKPYDQARIYTCLGEALALRDNWQAIAYLKKAYAINRDQQEAYSTINTAQQIAGCYLALGHPLIAKQWLDMATQQRKLANLGDFEQNQLLAERYTEFYAQTGQWKQAFNYQRQHYTFLAKSLKADREGAIYHLGVRYETAKKDLQLRAQQQELALRRENLTTQRRLTVVSTILFLLTGVACTVLYWLLRKYQRLSDHNAKLVKEQNHRVKNNLQSITSLLGMQFNRLSDPTAKQAVEESLLRIEAIALVHQRLYDGDHLAEVDIRQFIPDLVEGVLRIYSLEHIRPVYKLGPVWLSADVAINIGLLLNELVTNSCKYALPFHLQPRLDIGCVAEEGQLQVWFTDNGPGFTPTPKGNSFGMKLIRMITEQLKGQSRFETDNGCAFTLSFDLQPMTAA